MPDSDGLHGHGDTVFVIQRPGQIRGFTLHGAPARLGDFRRRRKAVRGDGIPCRSRSLSHTRSDPGAI
ncbi:MAG: hypothetical protein B7Z70_08275 [Acidithiobacillus ferrivorans]|uniref:Uncharacterized protein n=1 Tax=Acidithiobacillus ferrivorans TaxID=160808 RepID=A0A257T4X8_9PROT|nr:MAG: hypothetical protein B7Z70_08275 [Acidithiobacillus ferrivorans]